MVTIGALLVGGGDAATPDTEQTEDELTAVVLGQAEVARSRLIGAGEPGDSAANVRFTKGAGQFREVGGAASGDLNSVLDYYQSLSLGRLVVLGDPGAGKTVLLLELQVRLLEARERDPRLPVPVLVSAAAYDTRTPWERWLAGHLAERFGISPATASRPPTSSSTSGGNPPDGGRHGSSTAPWSHRLPSRCSSPASAQALWRTRSSA